MFNYPLSRFVYVFLYEVITIEVVVIATYLFEKRSQLDS